MRGVNMVMMARGEVEHSGRQYTNADGIWQVIFWASSNSKSGDQNRQNRNPATDFTDVHGFFYSIEVNLNWFTFDYVMLSVATLAPRCVAVQVSISTTENQDSSLRSHRPDAFRESDKLQGNLC
jgi:hypothetical protein